ncbi:hypothetical protein M407DRAFT_245558 [Tulasnella calospora MUT 4182]|uniref:Uncharacterized protein n=1 Tax=Tulasnella calospora MUT 4182 TaxID=1051891 RepID=A0A0C3Q9E3_9AGAM|nr:hypothetical protein M407DRAFT_245558 [Tulasnella calospora MUT 4182]
MESSKTPSIIPAVRVASQCRMDPLSLNRAGRCLAAQRELFLSQLSVRSHRE